MCGKASVSNLSWKDIYAWANFLTPATGLPEDPENRVNISPSRLKRKSDSDSMVWERLPVTVPMAGAGEVQALNAVWPFLPPWSRGRLPTLRNGTTLSTANARLRRTGDPFARTFMPAWRQQKRGVVWVSWFYEFDGRQHPKTPYAVFPLAQSFWPMAALLSESGPSGSSLTSVAIITVEPNEILKSVGHHRSPALLGSAECVANWLWGTPDQALDTLNAYPSEEMGVDPAPMDIKIPGNQSVDYSAPGF